MKNLEELRRLQEIHAPEQLKERTLAAIEQGKEVIDMKQLRRKTSRRYRCCSLLYRSRQRKPGICTRPCGYSGAGCAGAYRLCTQ